MAEKLLMGIKRKAFIRKSASKFKALAEKLSFRNCKHTENEMCCKLDEHWFCCHDALNDDQSQEQRGEFETVPYPRMQFQNPISKASHQNQFTLSTTKPCRDPLQKQLLWAFVVSMSLELTRIYNPKQPQYNPNVSPT